MDDNSTDDYGREIESDAERFGQQLGGTKDYLISVAVNMLVITICRASTGCHVSEDSNLENINRYLDQYDNADRYVYFSDREESFGSFKEHSYPLLMETIKTEARKCDAKKFLPTIKKTFEKTLDYLKLGPTGY